MLKNKKGFTLMEMLMVMFIIAILMLLIIPNITEHQRQAEANGCNAYVETVQTQSIAYEVATGKIPTNINTLVNSGYITSSTCSDGTPIIIDQNGVVSKGG